MLVLGRLAGLGGTSPHLAASTFSASHRLAVPSSLNAQGRCYRPSSFTIVPERTFQTCAVASYRTTRSASEGFDGFASGVVLGAFAVGAAVSAQGQLRACKNMALCESSGPELIAFQKVEPSLAQKCLAEAVGVGIIITGGCGVVASTMYCGAGLGLGSIAAVWGASVALAVYATRDISGAHLNPAVTVSLLVNKPGALPVEHALPYVLAQTAGAAIAAAVNYVICSAGIAALETKEGIVRGTAASITSFRGAFGMTPNVALVSPMGALACEIWMTAIFVFLVFTATDSDNSFPSEAAAPVFIGASVAALVSVFGPITQCGMNPARDLGPRLVTVLAGWGPAALNSWWIYSLGPIAGAVLGGAFYQACFASDALMFSKK